MKICVYCDATMPDEATSCATCGANAFDFVCENCGTRFQSAFCPNCGAQAGEKPRTCPNCGARSLGVFCPDCGQSLIPQARETAQPAQQTPFVSSRAGVGMVFLTLFLPFVGGWILLMDDRYSRNLKLFAVIFCGIASALMFFQHSWTAGLLCFAPIAGYGIKVGFQRVEAARRR